MQEGFLFDCEDDKQCGIGCDALYPKDKRLKFKWKWPLGYKWLGGEKHSKKETIIMGGKSEADLKNGWSLEVQFWHLDYEATVERYGNTVASFGCFCSREDVEKAKKKGIALLTRLDAQIKAEELFESLGIDIINQCNLKRKRLNIEREDFV